MFGLSVAAKAPSTTYNSIDFAIYIDIYNGTDEVVAEV
jgi:hypothetical protein